MLEEVTPMPLPSQTPAQEGRSLQISLLARNLLCARTLHATYCVHATYCMHAIYCGSACLHATCCVLFFCHEVGEACAIT